MRFLLAVILALDSTTAFMPRTTFRRTTTFHHAQHNPVNDFEHLLQETNEPPTDTTTATTASRRQIHLSDSQVLLASSQAALVEDTATATDESDSYLEGIQKVQNYQEQRQTKPTMEQRLKNMDLQDIVATLVLPSIALFAAGRFVYNKASTRVSENLENMLQDFAAEMIYHDGDFAEMKLCISDYSKKLAIVGKERMLKEYLQQYAKKKTISPQAISSVSYVFTSFKLSEEKAAQVLVSLCRDMGPSKISSAGKLLFLGSRVLSSPQGQAALQPIKEIIMGTYRDTDEAVAETMVETSQQAMAEAAYRSLVKEGGKNQSMLTTGWEVLGLSKESAQMIFDEEAKEGFVSYREAMYGGQTTKYDKKGRAIDKDGKLINPEEADDDDDEVEESDSNVYECSECGFTLFVAQGRESKFYGQGFKCPECGAPKKAFKAKDLDE